MKEGRGYSSTKYSAGREILLKQMASRDIPVQNTQSVGIFQEGEMASRDLPAQTIRPVGIFQYTKWSVGMFQYKLFSQ
jgi:hypothetical protein